MTKVPITIDPEILGGNPVFEGTRVPIQFLFEYLEGGDSLEEFLDNFPTVKREHALEVLWIAGKLLSSKKILSENLTG